MIQNTEQRIQDRTVLKTTTLESGVLKLGFADSFLHGRLGALLLKQLSEHAYGGTSNVVVGGGAFSVIA